MAVIFRHGPKKQTRVIRWDMATDRFEGGQWFKGSLYDRFADLSPSGDYMIYFANKHNGDPECWTAISKPPYLAALAFWPMTHSPAGGGIMDNDLSVRLNHLTTEQTLGKGFKLRKGMTVSLRQRQDRWGGDLFVELLGLNGWTAQGEVPLPSSRRRTANVFEKISTAGARLRMMLIRQVDNSERRERVDYHVGGPGGDTWLFLPNLDWADWDRNGDLLFARQGRLYRCPAEAVGPDATRQSLCLADFNAMRFEAIKPPPAACLWPYD